VHSILPLALRVKQPALHRHINIFIRLSYKHKHRMYWVVELAHFQLAAGGGQQSESNVVLVFVRVRIKFAWRAGRNMASPERVRNCFPC